MVEQMRSLQLENEKLREENEKLRKRNAEVDAMGQVFQGDLLARVLGKVSQHKKLRKQIKKLREKLQLATRSKLVPNPV